MGSGSRSSGLVSAFLLVYLWKVDRPGRLRTSRARSLLSDGDPSDRPAGPSYVRGAGRRGAGPASFAGRQPQDSSDETRHAHPPARYVFPVEGPPIADGVRDDRGGADRLGGPVDGSGPATSTSATWRSCPGSSTPTRTWSCRASAGDGRRRAARRDEVAWLRRVVDQRRGGSEQSLGDAVARNLAASIAAGTTLLADTTTAGLSWDHVAAAPGPRRRLRRADRPEARSRAPDQRRGLGLARDDPPGDPGRRLRPAGAQPARPLQHVGLALPQGRVEPAAALDPPGRDARGAASCSSTATARSREFLEDLGAWDDDWEPIGPRPGRLRPPRASSARPTG